MDSETSPWGYVAKKLDPEEVKAALKALVEDEEDPLTVINIEDEYDCEVKGIIVSKAGKYEVINCDTPVHIDYKQKQVQLPQEALDFYATHGWSTEPVGANLIRYVGLPRTGNDLPRNFGDITVLSLWNKKRAIHNVYLLSDGVKSTALLVNALSRLVFETCGENVTRTHEFYRLNEGPIDVAFCNSDERERREKLKQKKEADKIIRGEDPKAQEQQDDEDLPELIKTPMYFTIDEESILLFEDPFAFQPLHEFRFFREETEKSIDTIYVSNIEDQLEVQEGESVFFLYPQKGHERSDAAYKELVEILREGKIRPKSQKIFEDGKEFEKYYKSPPEADSKEDEEDSSSEDDLGDLDDRAPLSNTPGLDRYSGSSAPPSGQYSGRQYQGQSGGGASSWLNNLNSGAHLLANVNEDMQITWFSAEAEIESLIKENRVPQSDVSSSGLDPQSSDHLQTAVESIRDKLLTNVYPAAVSQWRGCAKVYAKTLLAGAVGVPEIEMLKRIFFLQG